MDPIPMPPPYGGVNEQVPVIALQAPNCENLLNFNVTQEGVSLRNGDSKYKRISGLAAANPIPYLLTKYGESKLFEVTRNLTTNTIQIYDVDSTSLAYTSASAVIGGASAASIYFNKYLFFLFPDSTTPGFYYDGAVFGAIGYTGANFTPRGGNVFKERSYIIQNNDASYWYSEIDFIAGALNKIDLNTITEEKTELAIIASVTIADNVSSIALQCFVMTNGEVLFYSGSYPDGSDWSIVGTARIGQPINYNSKIDYQGDTFILCDSGVVSLRDLFLKGSQGALNLSINNRIQETWKNLIQAIRIHNAQPTGPILSNIKGVWDPKSNRIIIASNYYLDSAGSLQEGSFYFVFDTIQQSWVFQRSFGNGAFGIKDIISYNNKVILTAPDTDGATCSALMFYEKEGATGFTDRNAADSAEVGYDYEIKSAPIANGRAFVQKAAGLDAILKSDLYAQTNYQFIRDFGVQATTTQKIPMQASTLQKPFVNMGIEGSYIQYKISGTTVTGKTVGYQMYGTNFWSNSGTSPR